MARPERPAAPQPGRPVGRPVPPQPGSRRPAPALQADEPVAQAAPAPRGSGWKIVLQFVIGLVVIAVVAGAIVYLYIKYYSV